ncbi:hypothetical protein TorRG33x02_342840 [Trema orientale]|uniref:Uncharacterized protein n=1 Tax=Trema orientale TaxID=63057 RepID=A0A2P5AS23_TREOI|nr:hypothetical protein TorRG33x02_342840 [Trema orientale]
MAARLRSLSKPSLSLCKSAISKPSLNARPTPSLTSGVRSSLTVSRQAKLFLSSSNSRFLNWVVFNLCFLFTQRFLLPGSPRVSASIRRAQGLCLRVCSAVQTLEFDISKNWVSVCLDKRLQLAEDRGW